VGSKIKRYHVEKHSVEYGDLVEDTIQIEIPVTLADYVGEVAIDSTGVKFETRSWKVTSELVKHLKHAYLAAYADSPSETDATVKVELYNYTDSSVVTSLEYAGEGGYKESSDIATSVKDLAGKQIGVRVNVTAASGTTGATQVFRAAVLRLVLGIS